MIREALPLTIPGVSPEDLADALVWYQQTLGTDPKILERVKTCPVCGGAMIACDNGWLDPKTHAEQGGNLGEYMWALMDLGPLIMMGSGGGAEPTLRMHAHQPDPELDVQR